MPIRPSRTETDAAAHHDVLIVGAGLSGIGAAHHLQAQCPALRFAILEGREAIGGTRDLFRYPGVRPDSGMYTSGYAFRPWTGAKSIAGMAKTKSDIATPRRDPNVTEEPFVDSTSAHIRRARDTLPRQGSATPWKLHQNYLRDLAAFKFGRVADGTMEFARSAAARAAARAA